MADAGANDVGEASVRELLARLLAALGEGKAEELAEAGDSLRGDVISANLWLADLHNEIKQMGRDVADILERVDNIECILDEGGSGSECTGSEPSDAATDYGEEDGEEEAARDRRHDRHEREE